MAVTIATEFRTNDEVIFTIIATADADVTTGNIAHGLGAIPKAIIIPGGAAEAQRAAAALSLWGLNATPDATNVSLGCSNAAGSGNAAIQCRVLCQRRR